MQYSVPDILYTLAAVFVGFLNLHITFEVLQAAWAFQMFSFNVLLYFVCINQ